MAAAKLVPHERIVHFSDLRANVLHEIMHSDKYGSVPITSLPGLTSIIKGLRCGKLTVITGPMASGRTTFLGQNVAGSRRARRERSLQKFRDQEFRLLHKLLQQFARKSLPTGDPNVWPPSSKYWLIVSSDCPFVHKVLR